MRLPVASMIAAAIALVSFAAAPVLAGTRTLCAGGGVSVRADFDRAGAASCTLDAEGGVTVRIEPETRPINPSPWYALALDAEAAGARTVTLHYADARHRYRPWVRHGDGGWTALPADAVETRDEGRIAAIRLDLPAGRTVLAGQPFSTGAEVLAPWRARAQAGEVRARRIGWSAQSRRIEAFETRPAAPEASVVILTRQHPPEEPGHWAFDAFAGRMLADDALARDFRARFAILALPLVNPDGYALGHWRSNARGVDTNRAWFDDLTKGEPETRAARRAILRAHRRAPVFALIDFHATRRDVMYAQPLDLPVAPAGLVESWLSAWSAALGADATPITRPHNPEEATSKLWGQAALGVSAVTYEVGDNTTRTDSERRAVIAAETLMREALARLAADQPVPGS